jgi:hypothetical protein
MEELSNNIEKSLKMKAINFQWFSIAMGKSTDVSDTAQLAASFVNQHGVQYN